MDQPEQYVISTDPERLDLEWVHRVLSTDTYWATGRSRERSDRAVANSLCYGVYHHSGRQAGIARVITDAVSFAWLCDVYIDRDARGEGLGKRLVGHVIDDLDRIGLRRVLLATQGAEELYRRFGFAETDGDDSTWMAKRWPDRT
ncbi:GNAT family N-acetyltransferase [Glycomyces arizonensis]|uniref:GNAT family N-acetyltransferase n=1 Tax=Glycomyces arizonensis TaxID=256035 RepID=UPI00040B4741|nr:GNAT family N-acetyltransferase [Glycomyces arizonensis]